MLKDPMLNQGGDASHNTYEEYLTDAQSHRQDKQRASVLRLVAVGVALVGALGTVGVLSYNAASYNSNLAFFGTAPMSQEQRNALRAKILAAGHQVDDTDEAVRAFLTPASVNVQKGGGPVATTKPRTALPIDPSMIDPALIWQIGKDAWQLVEKAQPIMNLKDSWAGAVPKGIEEWESLTDWRRFDSEEYKITFENVVGVTLTEFKWVFSFKHHGNYQGKGLFVSQAGASVNEAYAILGQGMDVDVQAFKPLNYGSTEAPVAGIDVQVKLTSSGHFEKTTVGCHVTMMGDGTMKEVTCDKGVHWR